MLSRCWCGLRAGYAIPLGKPGGLVVGTSVESLAEKEAHHAVDIDAFEGN